jgi:hypothetical protein
MLKAIKRFFCWMGWHSVGNYALVEHDGCNAHARCRWCGYKGMLDSQGNLF